MPHRTYAGVLVLIVVCSGWLELVLRTRVLVRWRRWLMAILPAFLTFLLWDLAATRAGHWSFDAGRVVGADLAGLPVEEVLFFIVVPTAGLLTLEAVRSVTRWSAGDEDPS